MWMDQLTASPLVKRNSKGQLIALSPSDKRKCVSLVERECCNYDDGYCLILDNGEDYCPQVISNHLCCRWFQNFVLPIEPELHATSMKPGDGSTKKCEICGKVFVPKSNRARYCEKCSKDERRKKDAIRKWEKRHKCPHLDGQECP